MTKEPADWAKIKAFRVEYPAGLSSEEYVLHNWSRLPNACRELARYIDKYEQPPVDPDLLAAREWLKCEEVLTEGEVDQGLWDGGLASRAFIAGIKHGRSNP